LNSHRCVEAWNRAFKECSKPCGRQLATIDPVRVRREAKTACYRRGGGCFAGGNSREPLNG
jgi:hypothetical protein